MSNDFNAILEEENVLRDEAKEEALQEYLDNIELIDKEESLFLINKLNNEQYKSTFSLALMQMALLISAALGAKDDATYNKIKKRIICDARQDDAHIKKMRIICLNYIDDDELNDVSANIANTQDEIIEISNLFKQRIDKFKEDYKLTVG